MRALQSFAQRRADAVELFAHAANFFAATRVPADVAAALGLSRLTALCKPVGGVRAIQQLVSHGLAPMFAQTFDEATRPYQVALRTCAGTDALSGMLHAAVDLDPATIVSLDGRSEYDTISRTAFLHKLHACVPWRDVHQGKGCEQGDAPAPALSSCTPANASQPSSMTSTLSCRQHMRAKRSTRSRRRSRSLIWARPGSTTAWAGHR